MVWINNSFQIYKVFNNFLVFPGIHILHNKYPL